MKLVKKKNKIKELREKLMVDQKEFGEMVGVSRTTVSDWENGKTKPSFENMRKLAELKNKTNKRG